MLLILLYSLSLCSIAEYEEFNGFRSKPFLLSKLTSVAGQVLAYFPFLRSFNLEQVDLKLFFLTDLKTETLKVDKNHKSVLNYNIDLNREKTSICKNFTLHYLSLL